MSGNFNYIKTFQEDDGQINTLALDSTGVLWQEDVTGAPGTLNVYDPNILPGSYAKSQTAEDEEWLVFSNLAQGTDIPRHGSNLDRISQVGPGAGPTVVGQSGGINVYNIVAAPNGLTQPAVASDPASPNHLWAANWSSGPFSTSPGTTLTIFYKDSNAYPTADANLVVRNCVYLSVSSPSWLAALSGTYIITGIGNGVPPGGSDPGWYFTVTTTGTGNIFQPGSDHIVGTYQVSLATMTTTAPAAIQVGDSATLAGVTTATWDGTYTISATVNGGQYQITATSLNTNIATYNYTPIGASPNITSGEQVTVTGCTNGPIVSGTSIFNVTNAQVVSATASQFTLNLNGANVSTAAENGGALVNGTIFQFDPGLNFAGTASNPIFGNSGGGTVTIAGPLGSGVRQAVTIFITRNGALTAPSPPVVFENSASDSVLQVSNILTGPSDVIGRIVAFTGANGGNFFYIPVPVTIQGAGQPKTYTATVINDNVTTSASFRFTDAVLLAATAIDVQGNDLFNQVELGSAAWNIAYAGRMFYGLENNKVQNFNNLTFDGGPTSGAVPPGWTSGSPALLQGGVVQSPIFGNSYLITNATGITTGMFCVIWQSAYQDAYQVPIILPNTAYSVRVRAQLQGGSVGSLAIDLYSPSANLVYGSYTLPVGSMSNSLQLFTSQLLVAPFQGQVPTDLQLRVYGLNLHTDTTFLVDRIEVFPTTQPVLTTELQGSYVQNLEAFDGVTGPLGVGEQNNQPALGAFINYDTLYILKTNSLVSTQDSPGNEPADWTIREVDSKVGVCGINAYDWGEEWAVWANTAGLWAFNGGKPVKISQQNQPLWNAINWLYGDTIWVRNDIVNRRIMVGVPMATPNQWLPNAPTANPTTPNVILMLNYKELNTFNDLVERAGVKVSYTGKLIAWDVSRKWSIWQIPCPYADFITQQNGTMPLYFGNGSSNGLIYEQVSGQYNDNGSAINSLYTTYGFVKGSDRMEFGPLLSGHRNLYKYLDMNLYGAGTCNIAALPNVLNATYPYSVPGITLTNPAQNNVERPINQTGNRLFLQFSTSTVNSGFNLSSCTVTAVKDPHAPVRGLG